MGSKNNVLCLFNDGLTSGGVWFICDENVLKEKVKAINNFGAKYGYISEAMLYRCLFNKPSTEKDKYYGYYVNDKQFLELYDEFAISGSKAPVKMKLIKCNPKV